MRSRGMLRSAVLLLATLAASQVAQSVPAAYAQARIPDVGLTSNYTIRVTFDSLTVHDPREGVFSGDGEYDLVAYVQGTKVGLTDASIPGDGLWDVSAGETVYFRPGTGLTVEVPRTMPLVIFTVGSEVDGCGRTDFYNSTWQWLFGTAAHGPTLLDNVKAIQQELNYHSQFGWHESGPHCQHDNGMSYPLDKNDILGVVTKIYDGPSYGAGVHSNVTSSNGDFTLRYTITVTPPPTNAPPVFQAAR